LAWPGVSVSIDLGAVEDPVFGHRTLSTPLLHQEEMLERSHTRLLIKPVGIDIELFPSTKTPD